MTNIGTAHRELFTSEMATALAKAELLDALPPAGVAVLNLDDAMFDVLRSHAAGDIVTHSATGRSTADVRARHPPLARCPSQGGLDLRLMGEELAVEGEPIARRRSMACR